jgi:hypothetical protein
MTIPAPPVDSSGGYSITTYTNGADRHTMRLHHRAFADDGTYTTPGAGTPTTVQADWTGIITKVLPFYNGVWTFNMTSLFRNNGDGTFTEIFGFTAPAQLVGTGATATPTDQTRAGQVLFNFKDGHGGRGRISLIGSGGSSMVNVPSVVGGASGGSISQQLVDQITNPAKTNVVSHAGHQLQSPAHTTFVINKRLRRHYGYA